VPCLRQGCVCRVGCLFFAAEYRRVFTCSFDEVLEAPADPSPFGFDALPSPPLIEDSSPSASPASPPLTELPRSLASVADHE